MSCSLGLGLKTQNRRRNRWLSADRNIGASHASALPQRTSFADSNAKARTTPTPARVFGASLKAAPLPVTVTAPSKHRRSI